MLHGRATTRTAAVDRSRVLPLWELSAHGWCHAELLVQAELVEDLPLLGHAAVGESVDDRGLEPHMAARRSDRCESTGVRRSHDGSGHDPVVDGDEVLDVDSTIGKRAREARVA